MAQTLGERYGIANVFWDQDDIEIGEAFPDTIAAELEASDTVVVIIGNKWLDATDAAGQRRLDNPKDFVRIEVATALESNKRVIPVLVDDAAMPSAARLPAPLARLADLNALRIDNQEIKVGLRRLADWVEGGSRQQRLWRLLLQTLVVSLIAAPLLFFLLGQVRFFEGFFSLDIRLESLLAQTSARDDTDTLRERLALIVIDPESARRLDVSPDRQTDWRAHHTGLIVKLVNAGARSIVFDFRFDGVSTADAPLRAALLDAKVAGVPVIAAASAFDSQGNPISDAGFKDAITAWGHACIGMKGLTLPTVNLVLQRADGENVLALSLAAIVTATQEKPVIRAKAERRLLIREDADLPGLIAYPGALRVTSAQQHGCEALHAGDVIYPLRFDLSPLADLRADGIRHAYADAIAYDDAAARAAFADRIVIVGQVSDAGERFDVRQGAAHELRHGVELQADAIRTLLDVRSVRDVLRPLATPWQAVLMTAMCVLGMVLALAAGTLHRLWRALLLGAGVIGYALLAALAYREARIVMPLTYPIAAALVTFFATRHAFKKGGLT